MLMMTTGFRIHVPVVNPNRVDPWSRSGAPVTHALQPDPANQDADEPSDYRQGIRKRSSPSRWRVRDVQDVSDEKAQREPYRATDNEYHDVWGEFNQAAGDAWQACHPSHDTHTLSSNAATSSQVQVFTSPAVLRPTKLLMW